MRTLPLTLTLAAAALAATPAAAAPPLAATWNGTATVIPCDGTCLNATSDFCAALDTDGTLVNCTVTLDGHWPSTCDGVGSGSLTVTDSDGDSQWANATLVASGGTVTFVARYAFLFDRTAVVATGTIDGGCDGGTWHGAFGGRGL